MLSQGDPRTPKQSPRRGVVLPGQVPHPSAAPASLQGSERAAQLPGPSLAPLGTRLQGGEGLGKGQLAGMSLSHSSPLPKMFIRTCFRPQKRGARDKATGTAGPSAFGTQPAHPAPSSSPFPRKLTLTAGFVLLEKSESALFEPPTFSWPREKAAGRAGGSQPRERRITMKDSAPPSIT